MSKPTIYPVKKLISLTDEQVARIDDFRYGHRIPSENAAIRKLIELGLSVAENDKPESP